MKPHRETLRELRNEFITAAIVITVVMIAAFIFEMIL
jgi:hypothetical protein